jgi:hypothetical protein
MQNEKPETRNGDVSAYHAGMVVSGTIIEIAAYGAWMPLVSQVMGLILIRTLVICRFGTRVMFWKSGSLSLPRC